MTALGVALLLGTSLAWAGLDASRKALSTTCGAVPLVTGLCLLQVPFFALWSTLDGWVAPESSYLTPALVTVVLNIAANVLFVWSVSVAPLSLTVPLLSLTPVFSAGVAWVLVGEAPSSWQWFGIAVVVAGALALHFRPSSVKRTPLASRGMLAMVGVALLWSITAVVDKVGADATSVPQHALVQVSGVALGLFLWMVWRREARSLRNLARRPGLFVFAGVAAVAALGLQLLAYAHVLVSLVEAVKRAIGMTAALVLGRVVFGEVITPRQVLCVIAMGAGTAVILLS